MSTLSQFGIPGIGLGYLQPKQKHRWRVTFSGIAQGGTSNSVNLSIQATNVSRPTLTFDEIQMDRYTTRAYVASKYTWDDLTMTFEDDINSTAVLVVKEQLELQQKLVGADGPWAWAAPTASAYKFGMKIDTMDGHETAVETWNIEGAWIKSAAFDELDYSASEAIKIQLTIRFDHAWHSIGTGGYGTAIGGNINS